MRDLEEIHDKEVELQWRKIKEKCFLWEQNYLLKKPRPSSNSQIEMLEYNRKFTNAKNAMLRPLMKEFDEIHKLVNGDL